MRYFHNVTPPGATGPVNGADIIDGTVTISKLTDGAKPPQINWAANAYLCDTTKYGTGLGGVPLLSVLTKDYGADMWAVCAENLDVEFEQIESAGFPYTQSKCQTKLTKTTALGKFATFMTLPGEQSFRLQFDSTQFQAKLSSVSGIDLRIGFFGSFAGGFPTIDKLPAVPVSAWNADGVDPTFDPDITIGSILSFTVPPAGGVVDLVVGGSGLGAPTTLDVGGIVIFTDDGVAIGTDLIIGEPMLVTGTDIALKRWNGPLPSAMTRLSLGFQEKSYDNSIPVGAPAVAPGQINVQAPSAAFSFYVPFRAEKNNPPTIHIHSPVTGGGGPGGAAKAANLSTVLDVTPAIIDVGLRGFTVAFSVGVSAGDDLAFHFWADASA